jgi:hypothetical protein
MRQKNGAAPELILRTNVSSLKKPLKKSLRDPAFEITFSTDSYLKKRLPFLKSITIMVLQ